MRYLPLLLAAFAVGGCATAPSFPEPTANWQSYSGQLQYVTPARSVIGEFAASRLGDDFRLEFSKGGSVPLLRISRHGKFARADGALARGHWHGLAAKAPGPLQGWVNEVPAEFAAVKAGGAMPDGSPRRVAVRGSQPGEKFIFIFSR